MSVYMSALVYTYALLGFIHFKGVVLGLPPTLFICPLCYFSMNIVPSNCEQILHFILSKLLMSIVPEINWIDRNVTIPEGDDGNLCFMSNIGTAQSYDVNLGVRGKGGNPASGNNIIPNQCVYVCTLCACV